MSPAQKTDCDAEHWANLVSFPLLFPNFLIPTVEVFSREASQDSLERMLIYYDDQFNALRHLSWHSLIGDKPFDGGLHFLHSERRQAGDYTDD